MAIFATVQVVYLASDVASSEINGFEARQMAEKGIAIGANPSVEQGDPILNFFDPENETGYDVQLRSEAARFNINVILARLDKSLLVSIFTGWEMELDEAEALVDALCDWVDGDDNVSLNGAEYEYYESLGLMNQPFNRPFYSLDEMEMVRGMGRLDELNPQWRDWFTVWSNGKLNVNEAEPELIAEAAEVSIDDAQNLVDLILGPDGERHTEDDYEFQTVEEVLTQLGVTEALWPIIQPRLTVQDETTRIESVGRTGVVKRKIVVIVRNRTGKPAILERKEEIIP
ncbi:general secretion pathway protein GspK [Persicirhabdus sediminis]|uniref:General secretion pathway protein GspK n=1 Tax=Persicirhabdus sediminis TaxID=454144 RepID=A0A8J7MGR5_9BACT|nr:type II secretion system protein GspK [Persicirhabdus sediminis]MBK1792602.1 general secretion pathway protein GspK [Persicirhabdus sediminis]